MPATRPWSESDQAALTSSPTGSRANSEPLAPATAQPGDLACTRSKSMRDLEIVAEPRMSVKRVSTPAGDTIEKRDTATSSTTTESQPGMNDGGFGGPEGGCSA